MSAKLNSSHIPKTRFEQAFINSLLNERGANSSTFYWIRLNDIGDTGEYVWFLHNSSSLPLSYTNWNKHQPGSQLFWLLTCRCFCFVVDMSHIIFYPPFLSQFWRVCRNVRWTSSGSLGGQRLQVL